MAWWRFLIPGLQLRRGPRVGVLNTGELVLLDDTDRAQVFSAATTDLIRDVLGEPPRFVDSTPLPPIDEAFMGLDTPTGAAHEFS